MNPQTQAATSGARAVIDDEHEQQRAADGQRSTPTQSLPWTRYWVRPLLWLPGILFGGLFAVYVGWFWAHLVGAVLGIVVWVAIAALTLFRSGERWFMQLALGWTPLDVSAVFGSAVEDELRRVLVDDFDRFDWYIEDSAAPNAFATGGHSIAVTSAMVEHYRAERLHDEHVLAVLLHEYAHHQGQFLRFGAVLFWLALPWVKVRAMTRNLVRSFRDPTKQMQEKLVVASLLVVVLTTIAALLALSHPAALIAVLVAAVVVVVALPAIEARASRAEELRADQQAAALGYGGSLRHYLTWWASNFGDHDGLNRYQKLMATHPACADRVALLPELNS